MSFSIILRREAAIDLDEIFVWYEMQKQGLGFEFINQFERILDKIIHNPTYASIIIEDGRSATLKRFPYEIIYLVDEPNQQVRIIAIIHQRRNPEWFRQRLIQ